MLFHDASTADSHPAVEPGYADGLWGFSSTRERSPAMILERSARSGGETPVAGGCLVSKFAALAGLRGAIAFITSSLARNGG
jgi:hypothetical protein